MSNAADDLCLDAPLSEAGRRTILDLVARLNEQYEEYVCRAALHSGPVAGPVDQLSGEDAQYLCDRVADPGFVAKGLWTPISSGWSGYLYSLDLLRPSVDPGLDLVQTVRLLILCGRITAAELFPDALATLSRYWEETGEAPDLKRLERILTAFGFKREPLADAVFLWHGESSPPHEWLANVARPYFEEREALLGGALRGEVFVRNYKSGPDLVRSRSAYKVLEHFSHVPQSLSTIAWSHALGSGKTIRPHAQRALATSPERLGRVLEALRSRNAQTRTIAAEWLGAIDESSSTVQLRAALGKEKSAPARDAMMGALERLGVSVDAFIDRDEIEREASQAIAKGAFPKSLAWLPFDQLPQLRWRRDNAPVAAGTAAWWLLQAHKVKTPDPGPLLRRQLALVDGVEAFGAAVLKAWLDYDLMLPSIEEAREKARRQVATYASAGLISSDDADEEQHLEFWTQRILLEPIGSATKVKGVLAVPAACGGEQAVDLAVKYIRTWYGRRLSQCKSLVRMLGWIDTPSAVQFLVATSKNFRTRGIRLEAAQVVEEIAERRGWTPDELADRMIPDGDLDSDGRLELDYGPRNFVAELTPALTLVLRDEQGKERRQLPKPGVKDDPEKTAESRSRLSAARRQIKSAVKEQTQRLFVAMCLERRWPLALWKEVLLGHPVMRELCSRLVWRLEGPSRTTTIRPSGGALLTYNSDPEDDEEFAAVLLAHDANTPPEEGIPWLDHFGDRALEPLFGQFARGLPELSDDQLRSKAVDDFDGYLISGFALRNLGKKLGYLRGPTVDGGLYYYLQKVFPEIRIEVHLEFTGNTQPEQDETTALRRLTFRRPGPDAQRQQGEVLTLAQVPRILLLECYRDVREIAESGDGFHPDWKSIVWLGG